MTDNAVLVLIKLLHTVVWVFFVVLIGYVLYSGLADKLTAYTWLASGLVVLEGLVLLVFHRHCPLTLLARRYSHARRANFDIYLPNWLAQHNQAICTSIYVAGLLLLGYRLLS